MEPSYLQCLLVIIEPRLRRCAPKTQKRKQMVVCALVPYIQRYDRRFCDIFARSGVTVLKDPELGPSLTEAIKAGRVEVIEIGLLKQSVYSSDKFSVYVEYFNEEIVKDILSEHSIKSVIRWCAISIKNGEILYDEENLNIIKQLMCHGTEMEYRHTDGGTILHLATISQNVPLVRLLLENGARVDARTLNGRTPLHTAAEMFRESKNKEIDAISILLIQHGADVNATIVGSKNYEGVTPLHLAVESHNVRLINCLLSNGAFLEADCARGNVLLLAVKCHSLLVLASVLSHRPDLSNEKKQAAFRQALRFRNGEAVKMLEAHGFRLRPDDAKDSKLLFYATRRQDIDQLYDLLKWGAAHYYQPGNDPKVKHIIDNWDYVMDDDDDNFDIDVDVDTRPNQPEDIVGKLLVRAMEEDRSYIFKYLIELDDYGSRILLKPQVDYLRHFDGWLKIILSSSDLRLAPILDVVTKSERPPIRDHILLAKAADLSVNEGFFRDLGQLDTEKVPEWLLKTLSSKPPETVVLEVNALKREMIGESTVSFHDLLNIPVSKIVRLLKNKSVVQVLKAEDYEVKFPGYAQIIKWRFRKAHFRRKLMDKGVIMFKFLFRQSVKLPLELQEEILDYLSNLSLIVFANVCELPDSEVSNISNP